MKHIRRISARIRRNWRNMFTSSAAMPQEDLTFLQSLEIC